MPIEATWMERAVSWTGRWFLVTLLVSGCDLALGLDGLRDRVSDPEADSSEGGPGKAGDSGPSGPDFQNGLHDGGNAADGSAAFGSPTTDASGDALLTEMLDASRVPAEYGTEAGGDADVAPLRPEEDSAPTTGVASVDGGQVETGAGTGTGKVDGGPIDSGLGTGSVDAGQASTNCDRSGANTCTNQACVNGICQGVCAPGQKRCDASTPKVCSNTGQWEKAGTCSAGTVCRAGDCVCPGTGGPTMVALPLGYCIDSTEVTRAQYRAWLDTKPSTSANQGPGCDWNSDFTPSNDWDSPITNPNNPVTSIDWCDAYAYCEAVGKRLCGKIGGGPSTWDDAVNVSKSQWYAACSSNGVNTYPYGNGYSATLCNVGDTGKGGPIEVEAMSGCQSSVVGYAGVFDLSGNVAEWEDSCDGNGGQSSWCHHRGGSFGSSSFYACDDPNGALPQNADRYVGLRCCAP